MLMMGMVVVYIELLVSVCLVVCNWKERGGAEGILVQFKLKRSWLGFSKKGWMERMRPRGL